MNAKQLNSLIDIFSDLRSFSGNNRALVLFRNHNRECWKFDNARVRSVNEGFLLYFETNFKLLTPLITYSGQLHKERSNVGHSMDQLFRFPLVHAISVRLSRLRNCRRSLQMVLHAQQEQVELPRLDQLRSSHPLSLGLGLLRVDSDSDYAIHSSHLQVDWSKFWI